MALPDDLRRVDLLVAVLITVVHVKQQLLAVHLQGKHEETSSGFGGLSHSRCKRSKASQNPKTYLICYTLVPDSVLWPEQVDLQVG